MPPLDYLQYDYQTVATHVAAWDSGVLIAEPGTEFTPPTYTGNRDAPAAFFTWWLEHDPGAKFINFNLTKIDRFGTIHGGAWVEPGEGEWRGQDLCRSFAQHFGGVSLGELRLHADSAPTLVAIGRTQVEGGGEWHLTQVDIRFRAINVGALAA